MKTGTQMKPRWNRRIWSALLVSVMLLTMLPAMALAVGEEPILTFPFEETLVFSEENTVVEEESYRTFKYTFTLDEETTLFFWGQNDAGFKAYFQLWDEADTWLFEEPSPVIRTLAAGTYVLWIDDDGYDLDEGYGTYTADIRIEQFTPPSPAEIIPPFNEVLNFGLGDEGVFFYRGSPAYLYTFTLDTAQAIDTLDTAQAIDFWSDDFDGDTPVHFHVFKGDDVNIFHYEDEDNDDIYIYDGHDFTLDLPAGTYTVVVEDCDWAGTAEVWIGAPMVTGVSVVDGTDGWIPVGTPYAGQILLANIETSRGTIGGSPVNDDAIYKWYYADSTDTVLGTEAYYTVTTDILDRVICVDVSVDGFDGSATWTAYGPVIDGPVYRLESAAGAGGSVSGAPDGTYGVGTEITVTATPDSNYAFSGWTAEGVELASSAANPAVFTMPESNVTLTANFTYVPPYVAPPVVVDPPWVNPFNDLDESDWFYDDVKYTAENGLFTGTSATTFSPNATMTRAMAVTVLWRLEDSPDVDLAYADFSDVQQGSWYEMAVAWAVKNGVASGYGEGLFGPNDAVSREQLAVILYRYAGSPAMTDGQLEFADAADVSDWALDAIIWAEREGILFGRPGNILDPQGSATRAEVAAVLQRMPEDE